MLCTKKVGWFALDQSEIRLLCPSQYWHGYYVDRIDTECLAMLGYDVFDEYVVVYGCNKMVAICSHGNFSR